MAFTWKHTLEPEDAISMSLEKITAKTSEGVKMVLAEYGDGSTQQAGVHLQNEKASVFVGLPKGSMIKGFYIHGDGSIRI